MSDLWKDQKPERQSFLSPCSVTFGSHLWLIFFCEFCGHIFHDRLLINLKNNLEARDRIFKKQESGLLLKGGMWKWNPFQSCHHLNFWRCRTNYLEFTIHNGFRLMTGHARVFCESLYCKSLQWILESCKSCKLIHNSIHQVSYGPNNYVHLKFGCMHHEEVLAES